MVGVVNGQCVPVPLKDVAGKLKSVPVDCDEIRAAKQIGISSETDPPLYYGCVPGGAFVLPGSAILFQKGR